MEKTIEVLALASLLFVFVCSVAFPGSAFMWLATATPAFTMLRIVLITLIATLLITDSFVDHHLHWLLGIFAASLSAWALFSIYNDQLQVLDCLSFLGGGISLGIEALRPRVDNLGMEHSTTKQFTGEIKYKLAVYTLAMYTAAQMLAVNHHLGRHALTHTRHKPSAI